MVLRQLAKNPDPLGIQRGIEARQEGTAAVVAAIESLQQTILAVEERRYERDRMLYDLLAANISAVSRG